MYLVVSGIKVDLVERLRQDDWDRGVIPESQSPDIRSPTNSAIMPKEKTSSVSAGILAKVVSHLQTANIKKEDDDGKLSKDVKVKSGSDNADMKKEDDKPKVQEDTEESLNEMLIWN